MNQNFTDRHLAPFDPLAGARLSRFDHESRGPLSVFAQADDAHDGPLPTPPSPQPMDTSPGQSMDATISERQVQFMDGARARERSATKSSAPLAPRPHHVEERLEQPVQALQDRLNLVGQQAEAYYHTQDATFRAAT